MDPFRDLARLIDQRARGHVARSLAGQFCELGTITATGLKLDGFKHEIRDYLKAEGLILSSGDRVLAVPVNGGQDVVIVCKVVS